MRGIITISKVVFAIGNLRKILLIGLISLVSLPGLIAQPYFGCDSASYLGEVDFTSDPDGSVVFEATVPRNDNVCCTNTDCVHVKVTVGPQTAAIGIDIQGAPGIGAFEWHLIDASNDCPVPLVEHEVGENVCLISSGEYYIAVCKPGSNDYDLIITSVPAVYPPPSDSVRVTCSLEAEVFGFDPGTIAWQSWSPGFPGQYNDYLDCLDCQVVHFAPEAVAPSMITYQVCGTVTAITECGVISYDTCHYADFYVFDSLTIDVPVTPPGFCYYDPVDSVLLTAMVSGGFGDYVYEWYNSENILVSTEPSIYAYMVDTFTLYVDDELECNNDQFVTIPINVYDTLQFELTAHEYNGFNLSCNGSQDGSIAVNIISGTGPYTYSWTGPDGYISTDGDISGLAAGTYSLMITDGNLCDFTKSITLIEPPVLTISETHVDVSCAVGFGTSDDGSIDITVGGGVPPYTFDWTNGATSEDVFNLEQGGYTVLVTDANDCVIDISATINAPTPISVSGGHTNVSCNDDNGTSDDGSIDLTVGGGTPPYSYLWNNGAISQNVEDLASGTYTVTVTDANDCSTDWSTTITQPDRLTLSETHIDVQCNDDNGTSDDGSIDLTVTGGTPPYTYDWDNGAATQDINGLAAGDYEVTVRDANQCVAVISVTIDQPPRLILSESHTNVLCNDDNGTSDDGTINLSVVGGTPPYVYSWSNGATTQDLTGLALGTYTVAVYDDHQCVAELSVTITQPERLTLSETHTDVTCNDDNGTSDDGTVDLTVTGGTPPYFYDWDNGESSQDLDNLASGTYEVTVYDAYECVAQLSVTINKPDRLTLGETHQNVTCNDDNGTSDDGSINLTVAGGTPPYTYLWNSGATSQDIENLAEGLYSVTVTDANECEAVLEATITQPARLALTETHTNVVCNDDSGTSDDGTIDLTVVGGTPPYSYSWTNGATTQDLNSLSAGTYDVTVLDALECIAQLSVTITQPNGVEITETHTNVTCNDDFGTSDDGTIDITVTGGTPPYVYSWNNGATTQDLNNLAAGIYILTVYDDHQCSSVLPVTITVPDRLVLSETHTNVTCNDDDGTSDDGSIDLTVVGGTPPYTYGWNNGSTTQDLADLAAGTYDVLVLDANECEARLIVTITQPLQLVLSETHFNVSCNDDRGTSDDGWVDLTVEGGTPPYEYSWSNGETTQDLADLPEGTYTVTVYDVNDCEAMLTITISQPERLTITEEHTNVTCFDDFGASDDGTIDISVTGGTPPYVYSWNTGAATQDLNNLAAGTYTLTVYDDHQCSSVLSVTITRPDRLVLSETHTNVTCNDDNGTSDDGSIDLTVVGGTSPYTYNWNNGAAIQDLAGLAAGTYDVLVLDALDCEARLIVTITQPEPLIVTETHTNVTCNDDNGTSDDGSIDLTVTGGNPPYVYAWSNGASTQNLAGLAEGTYTVTVYDAQQCYAELSVTITQPDRLTIEETHGSVICNIGTDVGSSDDGYINTVVTGGTPPYTYLWDNGETTANISDLEAGIYNLLVTDFLGCVAVLQVEITEPEPMSALETHTDVTCNDDNGTSDDGSIDITTIGGTAPYIYSWNNGAITEDLNGLAAGYYEVTIYDANQCEFSFGVTIDLPELLAVTETHVDVSCNDDSGTSDDGSIDISVTGGTTPYTYSWEHGSSLEDQSGLAAGTYAVTVYDANLCEASIEVTITQPELLAIFESHTHVTCNDDYGTSDDGTISVTVTGGTPPYVYSWSNGSIGEDLTGLAAGSYTLNVYDAHQCMSEITVEITQPDQLIIELESISEYPCGNVSCFGSDDGSLSVTVSGGTPPYSYSWDHGANGPVLTDLTAGTYILTVTDALECEASFTEDLSEPDPLAITLEEAIDPTCVTLENGYIDVSVTGGCPPYTYLWSNGATTEDIDGLLEGTYILLVIDEAGCIANLEQVLDAPDLVPVNFEIEGDPDVCEGDIITLNITVGDVDFQWYYEGSPIPGAFDPEMIPDIPGSYWVEILDYDVCVEGTAPPVEVVFYEIPEIHMTTIGEILICEGGRYTIHATEGFVDYIWYWDGDLMEGEDGSSVTVFDEGFYTVSAIDTNQCVSTSGDTLHIEFGNNPEPEIIAPQTVVCPDPGFVEIYTDNGYAIYQWYFNGDTLEGEDNYILEIDESGEYIVVVGDGAGCFGSDTAMIELTFAGVDRDTIYTEIVEMEGEYVCLEDEGVLELMGDYDRYAICREPEHVTYTIDFSATSVCINFSRNDKEANVDTMCIRVCDNSICELCDTTLIIITLPDIDTPPNAVPECVEVEENGEISVDVLTNDSDQDGDILVVSSIVSGPEHGSAIIQDNGAVLYVPEKNYCGEDTLYYEVCDIDYAGCDTAFVCITVLCDCWIPNVLTPNNDMLNDYFYVECLDQIDGAVLRVYNRWGNEVFRSDNYKNNWDGAYKGKPLPEGTYYYVVNFIDHSGERIDLAGHLTILR